ncbi:hypothetical protein GCM10027590_56600 [Nocardiopsis nanhaiensis]
MVHSSEQVREPDVEELDVLVSDEGENLVDAAEQNGTSVQVAETAGSVRSIADASNRTPSPGFGNEARRARFPRHVSIVSCMLRSPAFPQTNASDPVIPSVHGGNRAAAPPRS